MPLHHVLLWDVESGRQKLAFPDSHAAACDGLVCSPDGSRIATCSEDGTVRLWDPSTSKQLRALAAADSFPCMSRSVAFTRDGGMLAASGHIDREESDVGFVRIWDAQSGALRRDVEAGQGAAKLAFSNDGSRLAVETTNFIEFQLRMTPDEPQSRPERSIVIVDTRTGAKRVRIKYESAASAVKCLAFSPDDSTLIAADALGAINVWDATTGQLVRRIAVLPPIPDAGPPKRRRRRSQLSGAAISADCTLAIINGEFSDAITLWDVNKGAQVGEVKTESEGSIGSLIALSPDKRVIASAAWGAEDLTPEKHTLRLWDAASGRLIKRYQRPYCNRIVSLEFATDGRRLISGMSDGTALIWDVPAS
jgi:WD40 repeat protein